MGGEAGYGRPPLHSRFQKGASGNPKGRPKGSASLRALLTEELGDLLPGSETGGLPVSKGRAILKKLIAAAMAGDLKAASAVMSLWIRLVPDREDMDPRAADDEAFVETLAERARQTAEDSDTTSSTPKDATND